MKMRHIAIFLVMALALSLLSGCVAASEELQTNRGMTASIASATAEADSDEPDPTPEPEPDITDAPRVYDNSDPTQDEAAADKRITYSYRGRRGPGRVHE